MFHNVHLIVCLPMHVLRIVSRFSLCFKEHPCAMVSISLECHKVGLLGHRVCALFILIYIVQLISQKAMPMAHP